MNTDSRAAPAGDPIPPGYVTYADLATTLRADADLREDPSLAVRVLRESVLQAEALTDANSLDAFHAEPPLTGHPGWDALFAGVAVFTGSGRVSPGVLDWCSQPGRISTDLFDPLRIPARYRLLEMLRTPVALRERNVILAAGNLEGV
ncbi:hypothetical protein [Tsukamurella sp. NPDC003166]|uniref:hypothetical protein n=1 Tax=Tsukamurella sp. NPDC003166 TaxID=3154444 RepID=UPI0033B10AE9